LKYFQKIKYNDLILNNEIYLNNLNISNDDNLFTNIKKNPSFKKVIPNNNNNNLNSLRIKSLKKNTSYKNMALNSPNSTINKSQSNIYESIKDNKNNNSNNSINLKHLKKMLDKKSIKQFKINTERNGIKKMGLNSPIPRRIDGQFLKKNISEFNNCSFILNDKDNFGKLLTYNKNINYVEDAQNYKKSNKKYYNGQYSNTSINTVSNLKLRNESKKQRLIEINEYYLNNPSLISNSSFRNVSPESNKL
jgi:hypothetical protein